MISIAWLPSTIRFAQGENVTPVEKIPAPKGYWVSRIEALAACTSIGVAAWQWRWQGASIATACWALKWLALKPTWDFQWLGAASDPKKASRLDFLKKMAERDGIIYFSHAADPLSEVFGNFYAADFLFDKVHYICAESAYHAQKVPVEMRAKLFGSLDGEAAFRKAKELEKTHPIPSDWNKRKVELMREILKAKFDQNPYLQKALLATGSAVLCEVPPPGRRKPDIVWGIDLLGRGKNVLGELLMERRKAYGGTGITPLPPDIESILSRVRARRSAAQSAVKA